MRTYTSTLLAILSLSVLAACGPMAVNQQFAPDGTPVSGDLSAPSSDGASSHGQAGALVDEFPSEGFALTEKATNILAKIDGCSSGLSKTYAYDGQAVQLYKGDRSCKGQILEFTASGELFTLPVGTSFNTTAGQSTIFSGANGGTATIQVVTQLPELIVSGTEPFVVVLMQMQGVQGPIVDVQENIFTLSASSSAVMEGVDPTVVVTISRVTRKAASPTATLTLKTVGTAVEGIDYSLVSKTVSFAAAELTKTVTITIRDDYNAESSKTLSVSINAGTNYTSYGQVDVTIADDDVVPADSSLVLWLTATKGLPASNGSRIATWYDQSGNILDASQSKNPTRPVVATNTFGTLSGVAFSASRSFLDIDSTPLINSGGPYSEKTLAFAIKTGTSVTTPQLIFNEGDSNRGLNVYISGGRLYFNVWNRTTAAGDPLTPWGPLYTSLPVAVNTTYIVVAEFNASLGQITLSVNADQATRAAGGLLHSHPGMIYLGYTPSNSRYHDNSTGLVTSSFLGRLGEVILYGASLEATDMAELKLFLKRRYKVSF